MNQDRETRPPGGPAARGATSPPIHLGPGCRLETIEAVRAGLASADRGEGRPLDDAFDSLEAEFRPRAQP